MAATRLMPLHSGKGRTVAEALGRVTDYMKNPEKTSGGDLVTAYQCNHGLSSGEAVLQFTWFEKAALHAIAETGVCHVEGGEQKAVSRIQAGQSKNDRTAHRQKQCGADFGRDGEREKS